MKFTFYKYQGTGNDFIILDDRGNNFPETNSAAISFLCDRRFGIGADGFMLLRNSETSDFKMWYANSDGKESSMCGNGGRCIVAFARTLGIVEEDVFFEAIDGYHKAKINSDKTISLKMIDVDDVVNVNTSMLEVNTGSPHLVWFVLSTEDYDVKETGRNIQKMPEYLNSGINVNFIEELENVDNDNVIHLNIRTYERGVEDETLSCGTGAVASAISTLQKRNLNIGNYSTKLYTLGGELNVKCEMIANKTYRNIWLTGPAEKVFKGEFEI